MKRSTRSLTLVAVAGLFLAYMTWSWQASRSTPLGGPATTRAVGAGSEVAAAELLDPGTRSSAAPADSTDAAVLQPESTADVVGEPEPSILDPAATAQLWSDSRDVATRVFDGSVGEDEIMELALDFLRLSEGREFEQSPDEGQLMIEIFTEPGGGRLELRMRPGAKETARELQLITSMTDSPLTLPEHPHTGLFMVNLGSDEEGGVVWSSSAMDHVLPSQQALESLSGHMNLRIGAHVYQDEDGVKWVPMETSYGEVDGKPGQTMQAGDPQARNPRPSSAESRAEVASLIAAMRRRMLISLLQDD